jgi:hypothetical protein
MNEKKINVYAVRDLKGNVYDIPFFAHNDLFAARRFTIDCRGERSRDSIIGTFKEDFELQLIGEFNTNDGTFKEFNKSILKGADIE